jgi:hypothetical protein
MQEVGIFYIGHLVYFTDIWYNLWPFGIIYGHLVYLLVIWYIFPRFGKYYREKAGNPGSEGSFYRGAPTGKFAPCLL